MEPLYSDRMRQMLKEFKKTDDFFNMFREEFCRDIYVIVGEFYPAIGNEATIAGVVDMYAGAILNVTDSVIDKDRNYPEFRLSEELDIISKLLAKEPGFANPGAFAETVHAKVKELMVRYYPEIGQLSGIGFRLLERNARIYNLEFVANFYSQEILRTGITPEFLKK